MKDAETIVMPRIGASGVEDPWGEEPGASHERPATGDLRWRIVPWLAPGLLMGALGVLGAGAPGLWTDELATWGLATSSWRENWSSARWPEITSAPYHLLMRAWAEVFGTSDLALRAPSMLAMTATAALVGALGSRLFTPTGRPDRRRGPRAAADLDAVRAGGPAVRAHPARRGARHVLPRARHGTTEALAVRRVRRGGPAARPVPGRRAAAAGRTRVGRARLRPQGGLALADRRVRRCTSGGRAALARCAIRGRIRPDLRHRPADAHRDTQGTVRRHRPGPGAARVGAVQPPAAVLRRRLHRLGGRTVAGVAA